VTEYVPIAFEGDATDAVSAARQVRTALREVERQAEGSGAKIEAAASGQVAVNARQVAAQRQLYTAYSATARAAVKGSDEQIAASKLAERSARQLGLSYDYAGGQARRAAGGFSLFGREVTGAERGALAGSGAFSHLGRSLAFASGAFLGAAGFTTVVKDSIKEAVNLQAEIHRTDVTFGKSAGYIKGWSKTTADAFGMARADSLKWTNQFGAMLHSVGLGQSQASKLSRELVTRAADIGSVRNIDPNLVLDAFVQGLAGRGRALRQYGIVIDATRLKAEGLTLGFSKGAQDLGKVKLAQDAVAIATAKLADATSKWGKDSTQAHEAADSLTKAHEALSKAVAGSVSPMTNQQKALAGQAIMMKDTAGAAGEFEKNQGRLGEQMKKFHAQVKGLEETLGAGLLPVLVSLLKPTTEWLSSSKHQAEIQRDLHLAVQGVVTTLHDLHAIITKVDKITGGFSHTMELLLVLGVASKLSKWAGVFTSVGASAEGSAAKVGLLRGALLRLGLMAAIVIPIEILIHRKAIDAATAKFLQEHGLGFLAGPSSAQSAAVQAQFEAAYPTRGATTPGGSTFTSPKGPVGTAQIPATFKSTHPTGGLPGFPAVDIFADPGAKVLAPEDGVLFDAHFIAWDFKKRVGGWTIYYQGHESGNTYFMTHFATVKGTGSYRRGDVIGTVAKVPGQAWLPHIHVGEHQGAYTPPMGAAPAYDAGGGGTPPATPAAAGGLHVGKPAKKGKDVGAGTHLVLSDKLTPAQQAVAKEIYAVGISHGLTHVQALQLVEAAYKESDLDPNKMNAQGSGAHGLFQFLSKGYEAAYRYYRSIGFDIVTSETLAILLAGHGNEGLPTYGAYFKAHPNAGPGQAAAAVERSKEGPGWYARGVSGLFSLAAGGTPSRALAKPAPTRAAVQAELQALSDDVKKFPDDLRASIAPKLLAIGKEFEKMVTAANRRKVMAELVALKSEVITQLRSFEDTAWASVRDTILKAYDDQVVNRIANNRTYGADQLGRAQAQKASERAQGKIASLESGGMSPVMQTIKQKGDDLLRAYGSFMDVMKGASSGSNRAADAQAITDAAAVLAEAQDQWNGLAGTDWTDVETAYHDAYQQLIDAQASLAASALDDSQKADETDKTLKRKSVEKKLNKVYADLRSGKITVTQAEQQLSDILASVGLTMADLGNALDTSDLTNALGDLTSAIDALTNLLGGGKSGSVGSGAPDSSTGAGPGGNPAGNVAPAPAGVYRSQLVTAGGGSSVAGATPILLQPIVNVNVQGSLLNADDVARQIEEPMRNIVIRRARQLGGNYYDGQA